MGCASSSSSQNENEEQARRSNAAHKKYISGFLTNTPPPLVDCFPDPPRRYVCKQATFSAEGGVYVSPHRTTTLEALHYYPDLSVAEEHAFSQGSVDIRHSLVGGDDMCLSFEPHEEENVPLDDLEETTSQVMKNEWLAVRGQLKAVDYFDSPTRHSLWTEADGKVEGVYGVECASSVALWARVAPGMYQQRFVLPDGKRVASPFRFHESIPHRLALAAQRSKDPEKYFTATVEAIFESSKRELPASEVSTVAEWLTHEVPRMTALNTVDQLFTRHEKVFAELKYLLSHVEDVLQQNLVEVAVDPQFELGVRQLSAVSRMLSGRLLVDATPLDKRWSKAHSFATTLVALELKNAREAIRRRIEEVIEGTFGKKLARQLFPDLDEILDDTTDAVRAQVIGLKAEIDSNVAESAVSVVERRITTPRCVGEMLRTLRDSDRASTTNPSRHRFSHYYQTAERTKDLARGWVDDPETLTPLEEFSRIPHLLPRVFCLCDFFLIFPHANNGMKRPSVAHVLLWPEGAAANKELVVALMQDYHSSSINPTHEALKDCAPDFAPSPASSSSLQPAQQQGWVDAAPGWRGFVVQVNLAMEVTYNYYFQLDGEPYVDWCTQSFRPPSTTPPDINYGSLACRRLRVRSEGRFLTVNPLKTLGVML